MTWYIAKKELPDGREVFVFPLTFDRARLGVGPAGIPAFDDVW